MASNEDILMQFNAEDNITSVVEAMESSVTSALESITSAIDELDLGLSNLASGADSLSSSFGELESSFDGAETSASNFQSTLDTISGDNITDLQGDMENLSSSISDAESEVSSLSDEISNLDGTTIDINVETSGAGESGWGADAELGGELTGQDTSALRTNMYEDLVGVSDTLRGVGEEAVESASAAEQGWMRFGNAARNTGLDWDALQGQIKDTVKAYSNEMGRGVADTRTAMTTYMNMGMTMAESQEAMKATSNYAAQFGISQAEASKMIQMSFMGAGRSIKKLGLDIKDFKDESGNVDKEKLLAAIMEKTDGAADRYANSYEARVQRMNNAINSLRTDFGKEIINTIEPLLPIVQQAFQAFTNLPGPVKSAMLGFAGLAGGAAIVAGPLIKMKAYMNMAGVEMGTLRRGLGTLKTGFQSLSNGGLKQAITNMRTFSDMAKKTGNTNFKVAGPSTPLNTGGIAKNSTTVVKDASTVGALAPEAEAAAAGTTATSGAMSGIASAFTSMIVPLLAIAAVVAVMIPIIAGLAAEALIFIKGIQLLIDALDFDKIDLTGAIEGIKQIGRAMLELGIAMGEMAFASIMTGLGVLVNGITGLMNPVQVAGQMLIQAADELQVFKTVKINKDIPANIRRIGLTLKAVSDAMTSLTNITLNMAMGNLLTLGGLLGNVNDAVRTARQELMNAAREISQLKNLPDIDQGAVDKLKKVSSSLESVATAMDALRSLRDGQNWDNLFSGLTNLFGGVDIQSALLSVKNDIYKASTALSQFSGVSDIPDGVSQKLKKVADTLKSVSESVEALRQLRDNYNWDSTWGQIFQGTDIVGALNSVRSDLMQVATSLSSLNGISDIPEGTAEKINKVKSTLDTVMTTIDSLKGIQDKINGGWFGEGGLDLSGIPNLINNTSGTIRQVSTSLSSLGSIANVPEDLAAKIQRINDSINKIKDSANAMTGFPQVDPAVSQKIQMAVQAVRSVATQLSGLGGMNVNEGITQALSSVNNAINQLRATLASASGGFMSSGIQIGSGLTNGVRAGVARLPGVVVSSINSAAGAGAGAAWSGGARMGNSATRGFQSAFKIANIAGSEVSYATQAIQNGTGAFVQAVHDMAQQAVNEAKNTLDQHSPGHIARMWGSEMGFSASEVTNKGASLISSVRGITQKAVLAGQSNLNMNSAFNTDMTTGRLNALNSMNQSSDMGKTQRPVSIVIGEGAVQLDARNLTTQESRQIMINAIEGLEMVNGVDVKGA